ncbi:pyrethroid hydrolase [Fusarium longipes]|uniref:Pyrethroid hydrolase n=1 Tax=Fusarium longipes TaxID=694270 RepID=A0A395SKY8_9HYPO|nr:pyrethroid hydrolase [Fusarium longipes]
MSEKHQSPVILFAHGAWHQPKHYSLLIEAIENQGFTVVAPTLATAGYDDSVDGKALEDDVKAIRDAILPYLDSGRKVVAIGHSYGAVPLQVAVNGYAEAEREQKGLQGGFVSIVFIAPAPVLQKDISMYDSAGGQYTSAWFHDVSETRLPLKNGKLMEAFFNDVDESVANEIIPTLCHQSKGPFEVSVPCTPADLAIPKTLILCRNDPIFTKDLLEFIADKWGATVLEIESGHSPHLSETHRQWITSFVINETAKA